MFRPCPTARRTLAYAALGLACLHASTAYAALTLTATRLVANENKRSTAIVVRNPGNQAYAAQAWVNTEADDTTTEVPFLPTPALFRVGPGESQQVTVNHLPHTLPNDRESVFYFNLQEIPEKTTAPGNHLSIALRTRIKLFYRPAQFRGDPTERRQEVRWEYTQAGGQHFLLAHNPTPFHFSFVQLSAASGGQQHALKVAPMLAPFATQRYPVAIALGRDTHVTFALINDYGGFTPPLSVVANAAP